MSVESTIPYLGELIADRYQLESLLGEGGMGLVYAAYDRVLDRRVAIKLLWANAAAQPDAYSRLQREARVAATLRHPNVVHIYDFGQSRGRLFLVMELLEGISLGRLLRARTSLGVAEVARIGGCIADVLAAAHDVPLVHRDLKPANVFLDHSAAKERVVVLDFGLAFVVDAKDESIGRLTEDGTTLGTPWYMSPEQACNAGLSPASDVYALACVLFELCTGRPPFYNPIPVKTITDHVYAAVPSLREHCPEAPVALDRLVAEMLAKRPADRPTAAAVRECLAGIEVDLLPRPGRAASAAGPARPKIGDGIESVPEQGNHCGGTHMVAIGSIPWVARQDTTPSNPPV